MSMLDYLHWRGDLPLKLIPFCEVDALILSWAAYYKFEALKEREMAIHGKTLREIAALHRQHLGEFRRVDPIKKPFPCDNAELLFAEAAESERFGGVVLECFRAEFNPDTATQFAALSLLAGEERIIAYRGTDTTVAGWKEDFHLSFSDAVPAQRLAAAFLQEVQDGRHTIICGHSKGGNLAIYAALFAPSTDDIDRVYNFDGPGFCFDWLNMESYARLKDRICTIVPEASIIGMLLEHGEDYSIIESDKASILQHNAYCWHIQRDRFVRTDERSRSSIFIDKTLRDWLAQLSRAEREEFVNLIFTVIEGTGMTDFSQLSEDALKKGLQIMAKLPTAQREMAVRLFMELLRQSGQTVTSMLLESKTFGGIAKSLMEKTDSIASLVDSVWDRVSRLRESLNPPEDDD